MKNSDAISRLVSKTNSVEKLTGIRNRMALVHSHGKNITDEDYRRILSEIDERISALQSGSASKG